MKTYTIKNVDKIAGLMTITIDGNGEGLRNNLTIVDNNNNEFIIKTIAMTDRKDNFRNETVLVIAEVNAKNPIGTKFYV